MVKGAWDSLSAVREGEEENLTAVVLHTSFVLVIGVALLASAVFLAWYFDPIAVWKSHPFVFQMQPNTAMCLFLSATALAIYDREKAGRQIFFYTCLIIVQTIAILTLIENVSDTRWSIDSILISHHADGLPVRVPVGTTLCLLAMTMSIILVDLRRSPRLSQLLILATATATLATFGGYLYEAPGLVGIARGALVAICLLILCGHVLLLQGEHGFVRVLCSDSLAGSAARRLLPLAVVLPLALGVCVIAGQRSGWYSASFGSALLVAGCVFLFAISVVWTTSLLLQTESTRANAELESRLVQERLVDTEERFNATFEQAILGMTVCDLSGRIMRVNEAFCRLVGCPPGDLLGQTFEAYTHPKDMVTVADRFRRIASGERAFPAFESRCLQATGEVIWTKCTLSPIHDGHEVSILAVMYDITERREAERQLRDSEERLLLAVSTGKLGVWEMNLQSREVRLSESCLGLYGRGPNEVFTAREMEAAVHPEHATDYRSAMDRAIDNHEEFDIQFRVAWPDSSEHWVMMRGRASYSVEGIPLRMVGVCMDVTERRQDEERRLHLLEAERAARSELERVGRMKDEFLATLSHELRTPLNAIMGWSQILQTVPPASAEFRQGLGVIERNAQAQAQIIEDLLDMSRIISGKVRLHVAPLRIEPLIESALETFVPSIRSKGIRLETAIEPATGMVLGDEGRLRQVLWNLLSNAVKFTPRGGQLRIEHINTPGASQISVRDSGQGIDPAFLPYIFDRFRQADPTSTRKQGGLGLGLSIVKQLVDLHGGNISVSGSNEGGGTTFTLYLPFVTPLGDTDQSEQKQSRGSFFEVGKAPANVHARLAGIRVLIVDDEPDALTLAHRVMAHAHATVTTANSVEDAMRHLGESHFDVLLSDIGMPGQDGYDLIRRVREIEKPAIANIPAIALTAYARLEDRERTKNAGYQAHLAKPIEAESLISAVAWLTSSTRPDAEVSDLGRWKNIK